MASSIVAPKMTDAMRILRLKTIASAETRNTVCNVCLKSSGGIESIGGINDNHGSGNILTWLVKRSAIASTLTRIVKLVGRPVPLHLSGFHDVTAGLGSWASPIRAVPFR